MRRYNIRVSETTPQHEHEEEPEPHRREVYASETIGLLVIAVLLLAFTVLRYWHRIHWSLR